VFSPRACEKVLFNSISVVSFLFLSPKYFRYNTIPTIIKTKTKTPPIVPTMIATKSKKKKKMKERKKNHFLSLQMKKVNNNEKLPRGGEGVSF